MRLLFLVCVVALVSGCRADDTTAIAYLEPEDLVWSLAHEVWVEPQARYLPNQEVTVVASYEPMSPDSDGLSTIQREDSLALVQRTVVIAPLARVGEVLEARSFTVRHSAFWMSEPRVRGMLSTQDEQGDGLFEPVPGRFEMAGTWYVPQQGTYSRARIYSDGYEPTTATHYLNGGNVMEVLLCGRAGLNLESAGDGSAYCQPECIHVDAGVTAPTTTLPACTAESLEPWTAETDSPL